MRIEEVAAIVTGGASGLGEATARALAAAGARVTVFDRDATRGATLEDALDPVHFAEVDVTDEDSVAAGIDRALDTMGRINAVVNCAGIATARRTLSREGPHPLELFRKTVDVNLVGTFNVIRLAVPHIIDNDPGADGERGAIVNTASIAAFDGQKGQVAYAASKGGVVSLTLPLARDLASFGIRVCAIAPGIFRTPMLEGLGQEVMDGLARDVLFPRRIGDPEEFARLATFILSCRYLNAETIRLDGGLRMT